MQFKTSSSSITGFKMEIYMLKKKLAELVTATVLKIREVDYKRHPSKLQPVIEKQK